MKKAGEEMRHVRTSSIFGREARRCNCCVKVNPCQAGSMLEPGEKVDYAFPLANFKGIKGNNKRFFVILPNIAGR